MEHITSNNNVEITCRYCGVVSDWEQAFVDESTVRNGPGNCCITCKTYKDMYPRFYANIAFGAVASVVIGFNIAGGIAGSVAFTVFAFVAMYVTIILHELGHAAAAAIVGVDVPVFSFGGGRHVRVFRLSKRWLIVGLLPTEGLILVSHKSKDWYRLKSFVISAAGPFVNLACAGMFYFWLEREGQSLSTLSTTAAQLFVIFSLLTGISNLIPFSANSPYGATNSDGKSIINLFSITQEQIAKQVSMTAFIWAYIEYLYGSKAVVVELVEPIIKNENADIAVKVLASAAYAETGELEKGISICRTTLESEELERANRAALLNNLAYLLRFEDTPQSLAEADELSKEAFDLAPMLLSIRSTRASILAALGRSKEAIELTNDKRFKIEPKSHQAYVLCTQAIAYSNLGETDLAASSMRRAEGLAPFDERVIQTGDLITPIG